jgi:hypothetical protein
MGVSPPLQAGAGLAGGLAVTGAVPVVYHLDRLPSGRHRSVNP